MEDYFNEEFSGYSYKFIYGSMWLGFNLAPWLLDSGVIVAYTPDRKLFQYLIHDELKLHNDAMWIRINRDTKFLHFSFKTFASLEPLKLETLRERFEPVPTFTETKILEEAPSDKVGAKLTELKRKFEVISPPEEEEKSLSILSVDDHLTENSQISREDEKFYNKCYIKFIPKLRKNFKDKEVMVYESFMNTAQNLFTTTVKKEWTKNRTLDELEIKNFLVYSLYRLQDEGYIHSTLLEQLRGKDITNFSDIANASKISLNFQDSESTTTIKTSSSDDFLKKNINFEKENAEKLGKITRYVLKAFAKQYENKNYHKIKSFEKLRGAISNGIKNFMEEKHTNSKYANIWKKYPYLATRIIHVMDHTNLVNRDKNDIEMNTQKVAEFLEELLKDQNRIQAQYESFFLESR